MNPQISCESKEFTVTSFCLLKIYLATFYYIIIKILHSIILTIKIDFVPNNCSF